MKRDKKPKIKIVQEIEKRDEALKNFLNNKDFSDIVTVFKISKLSSSNLGTTRLRRLEKFSIKSSLELCEEKGEKNKDIIKFYSDKIFRRLLNESTREMRIIELKKY